MIIHGNTVIANIKADAKQEIAFTTLKDNFIYQDKYVKNIKIDKEKKI